MKFLPKSMRGVFFKRRYLDLRLGGVTINPLIQASNFTMLAYLTIENFIPLWLFVPLFIVGLVSLFGVIGLFFRRIQLSTDEDLKYEKQIEFNKTLLQIMLLQQRISDSLNIPMNEQFEKQLSTVRNIANVRG